MSELGTGAMSAASRTANLLAIRAKRFINNDINILYIIFWLCLRTQANLWKT